MITKDCQKKYILDIRCKLSDHAGDTSKAITLMRSDRHCKTRDLTLLDGFVDSLFYYNAFDSDVTYAYKFKFKRTDSQQITVQIDIGTESFSVTDNGNASTFVQSFFKKIENNTQSPANLRAEFDGDVLYVYSYSSNINYLTSTSVTVTQGSDQDNEVNESSLQNKEEEILNLWNCLTYNELCSIINGAYDTIKTSC